MLKQQSIKRKSKINIIDNFKKNDLFKNTEISINLDDLILSAESKINKITNIPVKNQQIRIVTKNAVNTFDFILAILKNENIQELTISIYRIGKKVADQLKELQKNKKIKKITILINDGFPKLVPDCWNKLKSFESDNFILKLENNHTKIILAKTKENYYIVEGSGNLSINARIEQYIFENNPQIYEFHKNWINLI